MVMLPKNEADVLKAADRIIAKYAEPRRRYNDDAFTLGRGEAFLGMAKHRTPYLTTADREALYRKFLEAVDEKLRELLEAKAHLFGVPVYENEHIPAGKAYMVTDREIIEIEVGP
jgi:hypothetical protein